MQIKKLFIALGIVLPLHMQGQNFLIKDAPEVIESYVNQFNREDNELYKQDIPNCGASDFLRKNIPFFECPDKELEKTYYFRWWTYRKHIKKTPDGSLLLNSCRMFLGPESIIPSVVRLTIISTRAGG